VKFLDAVPTLVVTDVKRSLRFYVEGLGFEVEWVWPFDRIEKAQACVRRGEVRLFLTKRPTEATSVAAMITAIFVDEIELLFEQLTSRFATLGWPMDHEPPRVFPWGLKEFTLRDPDGHVIRFCDETYEVE